MNDHILDVVLPIQFKDTLLIPIKSDIGKLFETNQIQFQISIKNRKIIIESQEISQDLEIQDNHLVQEAINVN